MKWLGYKQVPVSSVVLPGDVGGRMSLPRVVELARDIKELGEEPISAPTIQAGTKKLIAGRDRMAATLINKSKQVWVHIADATEQEAGDLEVSENLYRRVDNRDELIARRVRKVVECVALTRRAGGTFVSPQTAKAAARKKVAAEAGVSTAAVRKAEQRDAASKAAKKETGAGAGAGEAPSAPVDTCPIETLGAEIAPRFVGHVGAVMDVIEEAESLLRRLQKIVTGLREHRFPVARQQRLEEDAKSLAAAIRLARPAMVCPWCKDTRDRGDRGEDCYPCDGRGYIVAEQVPTVPKEFLAPGVVAKNGRAVATSKRKATLRIQDADGNPIDVTKDDPESEEIPF